METGSNVTMAHRALTSAVAGLGAICARSVPACEPCTTHSTYLLPRIGASGGADPPGTLDRRVGAGGAKT